QEGLGSNWRVSGGAQKNIAVAAFPSRRSCSLEQTRMKLKELGPVGPPLSHRIHSRLASRSCFLCFGGRFRLSGMTRVTAGAIPEFRAARRASMALFKTLLRFFIPAPGRDSTGFRN